MIIVTYVNTLGGPSDQITYADADLVSGGVMIHEEGLNIIHPWHRIYSAKVILPAEGNR